MKKLLSRTSKSKDDGPAAAAQPAPHSATAAPVTLPSELLALTVAKELSEPQKRGFAGLCACALPGVTDGSSELQWSKSYLRLVVTHFLDLQAQPSLFGGVSGAAVDEFLPMLTVRQDDARQGDNLATHANMLEPAPYLDLFVPAATAPTDTHSSGSKPWTTLFSSDPKSAPSAPNQTSSASGSSPWTSLFSNSPKSPAAASTPVLEDAVKEFRFGVLKKLLWFSVKAVGYDARIRTLLRRLVAVMGIPWSAITQEEEKHGRALYAEATGTDGKLSLEKVMPKMSLTDWKRNAKIGAAAVTGGALLAVTGGLAAPLIAGSLLAFGQAGVVVGTAVGTASGVTATSVLFGATGAGVFAKKTDTRTRGVKEFQFDLVTDGHGLNVYICISGWLDKDDVEGVKGFRRPWGDSREYLLTFYRTHSPEMIDQLGQVLARYEDREDELFKSLRESHAIQSGSLENDPLGLLHDELSSAAAEVASATNKSSVKKMKGMLTLSNLTDEEKSERLRGWRWKDRFPQGDQYSVAWDEQLLRDYGDEMRSFAISYAKDELVAYAGDKALTLLKGVALKSLLAAVELPKSILDLADAIDNVWALVMNAADAAGKILAESLLARDHGLRPVTLIGFGMGARMIISCLKELGKTPDECCGIVENAVLLGASVPVDKDDWASARRIVSGRLINGYSKNDWMLAIMYRYQGWALHCAGISSIEVDGVENVDLSSLISGHFEYKDKIALVLDLLKLEE